MSLPRFCVENFFNKVVFPNHTISASEDPAGSEAFKVGNGRRSSDNFWSPATTNTQHWIKVSMDQQRSFDYIAIDRGHNLEGETITLQISNDDSSWTNVFSYVVPSNVFTNSDMRTSPGINTEEGAHLYKFDLQTAQYARLVIAAMGTDLVPQIVGLWLGKSWEPLLSLERPFSSGGREIIFQETVSDTAWVGTSRPAQRYRTTIGLRMKTYDEYDDARYHVETLMWRRRPTWYVPDQSKSERAWLGMVPAGTYDFTEEPNWQCPKTRFPLVEHEPDLL